MRPWLTPREFLFADTQTETPPETIKLLAMRQRHDDLDPAQLRSRLAASQQLCILRPWTTGQVR